jgi:hypothetical protein
METGEEAKGGERGGKNAVSPGGSPLGELRYGLVQLRFNVNAPAVLPVPNPSTTMK